MESSLRHDLANLTDELTRALKDRGRNCSPTARALFCASLAPLLRLRRAGASWTFIASLFSSVGVPVAAATLKNYGALYLKECELSRTNESASPSNASHDLHAGASESAVLKFQAAAPGKFNLKAILMALAPSILRAAENGRSVTQITSELNHAGLKVAAITIWRLLKNQRENQRKNHE